MLRKLFGRSAPTEDVPESPATGTPSATTQLQPRLTRAEMEFLSRLSGQLVSELPDYWSALLGSRGRCVRRLRKNGLIEEAPVHSRLASRMKVSELKDILQAHGLKQSGRKDELARRIAESVPAGEVRSKIPDGEAYVPTDDGTAVIQRYKDEAANERAAMKETALRLLRQRNVRKAGKTIAKYESQQVFQRGMGVDWSKGMDSASLENARYLLDHPYADLQVDDACRGEIGAILALHGMLGSSIILMGRALVDVCGGRLRCQPLQEFLANPTGHMATDRDPDSPRDIALLYAHTMWFRASSEAQLRGLSSDHIGKGIELSTIEDEPCQVCHKGKLKYRWSELDRLPRLPRHWGCRCTYLAWL